MGRKLQKPRPPQGARLAALRKAAALSQAELAQLVGVPQANIAYWERSNKPPRSDVLPKLAAALGVRLEDLLNLSAPSSTPKSSAGGQVRKIFEEVKRLPRRQQLKVVEVVSAIVEQFKRRAS